MAGASPAKRGRPKINKGIVRIRLREDIYDMWITRKDSLGFSVKTHSEFAEYLMLHVCEESALSTQSHLQTPSSGKSKF